MEELIRWIRECSGISQTEMGRIFSVDFTTINRWENGRSVPNKTAQEKIFGFCKEREIPLYEHIIQKIKDDSEEGILYHGSKSGIIGKIKPASRNECDFGRGFYMSTIPEQPIALINDYEKSKLYLLLIDEDDLTTKEIVNDLDWALIIALNRNIIDVKKYPEIKDNYLSWTKENDVLIGDIADDKLFIAMDYFFKGTMTDTGLIKCLKAMKLGKQHVALTQRACDSITVEGTVSISSLERMAIRNKHIDARNIAQKFVNDTLKANRRDGKYFDEILEEWK